MRGDSQDGWDVLGRAHELSQRREAFALATVVWRQGPSSGKEGSRAIVQSDGSLYGWIGGACAEPVLIREAVSAIEDGESRLLLLGMDDFVANLPRGMVSVPLACQSDGALQVHIEPVVPAPQVVVIGRSPMVHTLAELVQVLGWEATQSDDSVPDAMPTGAAVVVATQGHGDEEMLLAVLKSEPSYVGLVASAKRGDVVLAYLRDQGVSEDVVSAIRVPAGIDLGSTSHKEMAASILAELVATRARGELGSEAASEELARPATAIDPICGMTVAADDSSCPYEHQGLTYYFCCPGCRATFEEDPESHLRSVHAD